MLRRSLAAAVLLSLSLVTRGESDEPPVTALWDAFGEGRISVDASSRGGAASADLAIANLTSEVLVLDVNGALVVPIKVDAVAVGPVKPPVNSPWTREKRADTAPPPFSQTQPLGVGLVTVSRKTTFRLEPGEHSTFSVVTVCLNQQVPAPYTATPLALAKTPAPDKARAVLSKVVPAV